MPKWRDAVGAGAKQFDVKNLTDNLFGDILSRLCRDA